MKRIGLIASALALVATAGGYFLFLNGPSKQMYAARADLVCQAQASGITNLDSPTNLAQLQLSAAKLEDNLLQSHAKLSALERPRRIDQVNDEGLLSKFKLAGEIAGALSEAAENRDLETVDKGPRALVSMVGWLRAEADLMGLDVCGRAETLAAKTLVGIGKDIRGG